MISGILGAVVFGFIGFLLGYFLEAQGILGEVFKGLSVKWSCAVLAALLGLVVGIATHWKRST